MKKRFGLGLITLLFVFFACETEEISEPEVNQEDIVALVGDEVIADIDFAELLDIGDDGIFWGDASFNWLKSGDKTENTCPSKVVEDKDNKRIVTLTFGDDCEKSGEIKIVYFKPSDKERARKKTITYKNFTNKEGVTFNGTKEILRDRLNYNIKGRFKVSKTNQEGDPVIVTRKYERQVSWICGLVAKKERSQIIKKVTGEAQITKKVGDGEEMKYTRKILRPLLVVKACDLKIQAGVVGITKSDGSEVKINYGKKPKDIDCDSEFECGTELEVTKDGETYKMKLEDRKRVKVEMKGK